MFAPLTGDGHEQELAIVYVIVDLDVDSVATKLREELEIDEESTDVRSESHSDISVELVRRSHRVKRPHQNKDFHYY